MKMNDSDELISGAMEADKLLREYNLKSVADYECKKADCLVPLNMKERNEIWSRLLSEPFLKMKRELENREKIHCEQLGTKCYPAYLFKENQKICSSCKDYLEIISPKKAKMDRISVVQQKLREEWEEDERKR